MTTFKTSDGREWNLAINAATVGKLKRLGVDVGAPSPAIQAIGTLTADNEKLARVAWALCESQAAAGGVTPEAFAESLDGDTLESAMAAFRAAVVAYTSPRVRQGLIDALSKQDALLDAAVTAFSDKLGSDDFASEMKAEIDRTLAEAFPASK